MSNENNPGTSNPPAVLPVNINAAGLKDAAVAAIVQGLTGIIQGAAADVQNFVQAIVQDAIEAAAENDQVSLAALNNERKVLQEINRVRIAVGSEQTAAAVMSAVLTFTVKLLGVAVAGAIVGA